jgi:hypothetical protein
MKRRSPTLEGFQTIFRQPCLGLAEIAWRWSFGAAVVVALAFALREYLATLPVTAGEMLLLRSRQPALMLQAIARIFQGSAPRATGAFVVLTLSLTVGWIVLASLGRAATLQALFEHFGGSVLPASTGHALTSLLTLNALRATTMLAATVGLLGAALLAAAASSPADSTPGVAVLMFWMLFMLIGLACSMLNWYLSLAAVFAVRERTSAFGALVAATDLCRARPGSLAAAATWFGLAHTVVFVVASTAAAFPLGFAEALPGGMVFGGLLLVTLLYFAAVDFLYIGRLASYVFMIEQPEPLPQEARLIPEAAI